MMTRHSSYPRNIHKIKTIQEGIETIVINGIKYHIAVVEDMIAACYNEKDNTYFCLDIFGVDPINQLFEKCGVDMKFESILEF